MLGKVKQKPTWNWLATGKHPVAGDYFQLGVQTPLLKAFGDWVTGGYNRFVKQASPGPDANTWRFWARGAVKDHIVCGLLRDSSDRVGRVFPLVIAGTGPLNEWEKRWERLPAALEKTWRQIEYLATRRYTDTKQMEADLLLLTAPVVERETLKSSDHYLPDTGNEAGPLCAGLQDVITALRQALAERFGIIPLHDLKDCDQQQGIAELHSVIRQNARFIPNAVFMGGTAERAYLVTVREALMPGDFVRLWTAATSRSKRNLD